MQRSTDRILTTHVGALQRPPELSKALTEHGEWAPDVLPELRAAVAEVVARQERAGIDVVDDGEFGKTLWMWYVRDRIDGIGAREWSQDAEPLLKGRDRDQFPGFYAWADANASIFGYMEDTYFFSSIVTEPVVTGPLRYKPEAVQRDIANLKDALRDNPALEAFMLELAARIDHRRVRPEGPVRWERIDIWISENRSGGAAVPEVAPITEDETAELVGDHRN